jgi:nitrous oxidase accessory protein NosD
MVNAYSPMIFGANPGIDFGDYCQGFIVNNLSFTNGGVGVFAPSGDLGQVTEFQLYGGQISFNTGDGIIIESPIGDVVISGMDVFTAANHDAINVGSAVGGAIYRNTVNCTSNATTNGIAYNGSAISITGNQIGGCGSGVTFFGSSSNNSSQSNLYIGDTTNATNVGAASNHFGSCTGVTGTCSSSGASP